MWSALFVYHSESVNIGVGTFTGGCDMAQREKISVSKSGVQAEGLITSLTVAVGGIGLLAIGFFTGQWSALINACLGFKFR
jgi:hypothetical protein